MKTTNQTLIDQLKITKREIYRRKAYFNLTEEDSAILVSLRNIIDDNIEEIVESFYEKIIRFAEMDRIIGDAETLHRVKNHQRNYIFSLFDGQYDEEYVLSRLRVGVVHKRIGVDPKFYVSAVYNLSSLLRNVIISSNNKDCSQCASSLAAIEKILMFDLSLCFDTYIKSLMDEVETSKTELAQYAQSLEEVISERTKLLKKQARHDGLTSLLNQHSFYSELRRELLRGQRRSHSTALIYFDLDHFKQLNDAHGHKRGDEILVAVAESMRSSLRETDILARYGGDEFCVILSESSLQEAEQVCRKICEAIKKSTKGSGVSCSMGIAMSSPEKNVDANFLVQAADKAMYEAKKEPGFSVKVAEIQPIH